MTSPVRGDPGFGGVSRLTCEQSIETDTPVAADLELSIIIPALDAAETIGAQLDALVSQAWPGDGEILVADNGSTDGTSEVAGRCGTDARPVRVIDASCAAGAGGARNVAAASARGHKLLFCDADDIVGERWVAAHCTALAADVVSTGPLRVDELNDAAVIRAHGTSHLAGPGSFHGLFEFAPSSNLGVNAPAFREVGGFDESLRTGEDVELCHRLGLPIAWNDNASVSYRYRATTADRWHQGIAYGEFTPLMMSRLSRDGVPGLPPRFAGLRQWAWLIRRLPALRSAGGRQKWIWVAAQRAGRLRGSFRARSLWL